MAKKRIMVVEDEGITAMSILNSLKEMGYAVIPPAFSADEAIERAREARPDLVLMDITLRGEKDGIEAAGQIHTQLSIPVVYVTALSDEKMMKRIKMTEPFGYIAKPFEDKELKVAIEIALYKYEMETRLRESEERYREVVEGTGDLVTRMDDKGKIIYVNHVSDKIFGVKAAECTGMSAFQFTHPNDRAANIEWFNICVQRQLKQASIQNRQVNRKTDDLYYMLWTSNFFYDEKGKVNRVNSIARDITDRVRFEEQMILQVF
jgi:PAS domain S-box-containing protein